MFSLLTNTSAMTALRSLQSTERDLASAEKQLSTGLRISDASDNPAYWSIAVGMRSRVEALNATNDGLSLTVAGLNTAQAGLTNVLTSLNKILQDTITSAQPGVSLASLQQDITARQDGMRTAMSSATFNGINQLTLDLTFTSSGHSYDALTLDVTTVPPSELQALAGDFGQVIKSATASGAQLAGQLNQAKMMQSFNASLSDALTTGIGALVDADMNLVSTRIQALKTQRQLGIIALSIANDNAKLILKLFGA